MDYAIIVTYAVLLMGTDAIKWIWGAAPQPVSDPVGLGVRILDINLPLYRIFIVISALVLFGALRLFFSRSIVGKIVAAACIGAGQYWSEVSKGIFLATI